MARGINPQFAVYPDVYSAEKFTSIDSLTELKVAPEATLLHPAITQLFARWGASGDGSAEFPLYLSTLGEGNVKLLDSTDLSSQDRVLGRPRKGVYSAGSPYSSGTPGKNKTFFEFWSTERYYERDHEVESPSGQHCKIYKVEPRGNKTVYTMKVLGKNVNAYVPLSDFAGGKLWTKMPTRVGLKGSRGNSFKGQAWSKVRNSAEFVRDTLNYEGNVGNKVLVMEAQIDDEVFTTYVDFEKYLFELQMMSSVEYSMWWSRYNRDTEGNIMDYDINSGEPTPHMSGIDEQIMNSRSVSTITESMLSSMIDEVFYNASQNADGGKVTIELHTGTLGRRLFSEALHTKMNSLNMTITVNDGSFVRNVDGGLEYGGYFVQYKHVDGHTIKIVYNAVLDKGPRALKSANYPGTNLPKASGDMYFIDKSTYSSKPNLIFLAEEGNVAWEKAVLGVNDMNFAGYNSNVVSNDIDASSIEFGRTAGLHHPRPTNSFKMLLA